MNSVVVLDSSVAVKLVVAEPDSDHADKAIARILSGGGSAVILDIAMVEVTNAIWKQYLRGVATADECD